MKKQLGLYFEEFEEKQKIESVCRTVTEHDVMTFAGLSGDYNQIHTDREFSSKTPFGKRIAHGVLILAMASGLAMRTGFLEGTVLAFREISNWKFSRPVFFDDTIYVILEVREKKAIQRLGGGLITIDIDVLNQNNEVVMRGVWIVLVASKPETTST